MISAVLMLAKGNSSYGAVQTLKSFGFPDLIGITPMGGLIQGTDGKLYGTTSDGGIANAGTVFRVNLDGTGYRVLKNFSYTNDDGAGSGALIADGSVLYGVVPVGGHNHEGTVFRMNADGTGYQVLHSFTGTGGDGANPGMALLLANDGVLYGTTTVGGSNYNGCIFKLNTNGTGYAVIKWFTNFSQGINPDSPLIAGGDGTIYGTTYNGGSHSWGVLFKIAPDGSGYTVLHSFSGAPGDGANPVGPLLQGVDGALYGTTYAGGSNFSGTIFRITTDGIQYAVLKSFGPDNVDGTGPQGGLIQGSDGALYGTTTGGGTNGDGTVFTLSTNGGAYSIIENFGGADGGAQPQASVIQGSDGKLYGTLKFGGVYQDGSLFSLNTDGSGYASIWDFKFTGGDGAGPQGPLVVGTNGWLYGATVRGGSQQEGLLFGLNTNGSYVMIRSFGTSPNDGLQPNALIKGFDDTLYGTTSSGGDGDQGIAFKMNPDGSGYQVLKIFFGTNGEGAAPAGALLLAANNALYGTTDAGGVGDMGTVYRLTKDGSTFTTLKQFTGSTGDGAHPETGVIQGKDGFLYGTTARGGAQDFGTVFKLLPDGTGYTVLKQFSGGSADGFTPQSGVVQASDGALLGVTLNGGSKDLGTVYRVNPDGTGYAILHMFGGGADGDAPFGSLYSLNGTLFYGTTAGGGIGGHGTVFMISSDGTDYAVIHSFAGTDGDSPKCALVAGGDGSLFGATTAGGELGLGTIFRFVPEPTSPFFVRLANNGGTLSVYGVAGQQYVVQSAAAPAGPWSDSLSAVTADTSGVASDVQIPTAATRFYRARLGP